MSELEFVEFMNPQRLTSFAEDLKKEPEEFLNDELKKVNLERVPFVVIAWDSQGGR